MTQIQTELDAQLKFNSFHASGLPLSNKVKPVSVNEPFSKNRDIYLFMWHHFGGHGFKDGFLHG